MPISAALCAPPHGVSSSVSGQGLRVSPPATSVVAVGAVGGVRCRRQAVVGVVAASAASPDVLHARGRPFHGSSEVVELSEPSCPGVHETIQSVVHGLLVTLSPKMHTKAPPPSENMGGGTLNFGKEDDDCAELVEDTSLPSQPLISIPRDHLTRLLFWCMLLGHYIRGLECQLELSQLLAASSDVRL